MGKGKGKGRRDITGGKGDEGTVSGWIGEERNGKGKCLVGISIYFRTWTIGGK